MGCQHGVHVHVHVLVADKIAAAIDVVLDFGDHCQVAYLLRQDSNAAVDTWEALMYTLVPMLCAYAI